MAEYLVMVADDLGVHSVRVEAECGCTHDMQAFFADIPDFVHPHVLDVVAS
jgi:hypothetical protein